MAYGVFASNYSGSDVVHLKVKLWPETVPGSGGSGNTRPTEGKMFPSGK
jgi:hypothetical protein